ncbi:hypothetical protein [Streptomyces sp. NPDC003023]|uniref:hypothetical protein n=1 Tax=Streptomyces sp. NPDC003023 TaxID=3364675 RepID=UPI00369683CB
MRSADLPSRRGVIAALVTIAVLIGAGTAYVAWAALARHSTTPRGDERFDASHPGTLLFVDERKEPRRAAQVPTDHPDAEPLFGPAACVRQYAAGGTSVCMRRFAGPAGYEIILDANGRRIDRKISVWGVPSRARVSPSGRLVAWTVFRDGDSYLAHGFSTTTGIYDLKTKTLYGSLEDFTLLVDNRPFSDPSLNFWGVTFHADDQTFYATAAAKGRTWLVRGDLRKRSMTALRTNAECPSLSPDGRHLIYKKKTATGAWRLHHLDLTDGRETPLAEAANIDDQVAWLDNHTVAYAKKAPGGRSDLYAVDTSDGGTPRLLRRFASSPAFIPNSTP